MELEQRVEARRMNPHHAAALALVGWYLMLPTAGNTPPHFARWEIVRSFDTAIACKEAADHWRISTAAAVREFAKDKTAGKESPSRDCASPRRRIREIEAANG